MAGSVPVDSLEIQIEASSTDAVKKVNNLIDAIKRLSKAGSEVGNVAEKIRNIGTAADQSSTIAKTKRVGKAGKEVSPAFSQAADSAIEKVNELESKNTITPNVDTGTFQSLIEYAKSVQKETEKAYQAIEKMKESISSTRSLWSDIASAPANAFDALKTKIAEAMTQSNALSKAVKGVKYAFNTVTQAAKKIGGAIWSGLKSVGKTVVSKVTSPFKKAAEGIKNVTNAIGRIAFYRAIRQALKMISEGFKEGTSNLYQYSKQIGTDFAPAMDKLATSALYLKNSMGAIAAPLIEAIAPAVDILVDKFVELLNVIGKVFAALSGKSTYSQALKFPKEYAEAANGAAKAAKNFTLGIDELNVISESVGGGAGAAMDYGSMFKEVEVPTGISDWAKSIRDAIEADNWKSIGSILADKLNGIVSNLPMDKWGKKLGENIQKGLDAAYGFLKKFNFTNLGEKFSDGINGIVENINWNTLGQTITAGFTGVLDFVIGFLGKLNWPMLGESFGKLLRGAFDGATEWIKKIDWSAMAHSAYQNLKLAIEKLDLAATATSFFRMLGTALGAGVSFIATFINDVVKDIKNYFLQYIKDENGDGKFGAIEIINGILEGLLEGIKGIGTWIKENIFNPFIEGFKSAFKINSTSKVMEEQGGYIIDGLFIGLKNGWGAIAKWFNEKINGIVSSIQSAWASLSNLGNTAQTKLTNNLGKIQVKTTGKLSAYASGGFPTQGQMFIAREAGPELIGNIGQKTAVVNNDQIIQGISNGVENANQEQNALLREQNALLRALLNKDTSVRIGNKEIKQAYDTAVRQSGASIMAGGVMA